MTSAYSSNEPEPVRRTSRAMDPLRWLFSVSMGLSLVRGVQSFILDLNQQSEFRFDSNLIIFVIFCSFLTRFTQGYLRHLDMAYLETAARPRGYQPLVDFTGILLASTLFIFMAFSIREHREFATYLLALVVVDSLWLMYLGPQRESRLLNWILTNGIFAVIWAVAYFIGWNDDAFLITSLIVATIVHTAGDYCLPGNWQFYFDQDPPQPVKSVSGWLERCLDPAETRLRRLIGSEQMAPRAGGS